MKNADLNNGRSEIANTTNSLTHQEHALRDLAVEKALNRFSQSIENIETFTPDSVREMLHELRVHQIELELQNEELRRAQEELDAARTRYFDLYDMAPIGYVTLSEQGLILEANLTLAGLLGVDRGALVRQPLTRFILKEDQDSYYFHRRKLLETGERRLCELRMATKDGTEFWARLEANAARDVKGVSISRLMISDITESKRAETERQHLHAQLLQSQKMEVVGQLAGGIAHDFNNILATIIMQLDFLRIRPDVTPDSLQRTVGELLQSANRAANLIRQLLLFSGRQPMTRSRNDANVVILELTKLLERLIGEQITLAVERHEEPLWIDCDTGMIGQVLTNLCVNARDAMPKGGLMTIAIHSVELDAVALEPHSAVLPGPFVCLSVSDTGSGMEPAVLARIFEPFFTTKLKDKGTGLGLSTVNGIVAKHGGFVEVETQLGKGSTFSIYLPQAARPVPALEHDGDLESVRRGHESILFIEDEDAMRRMAVYCLRELGYHVTEAANGVEALKIWERENGAFDLLFTDMVMPGGISGLDLCSRLKEKKAGLRTIISSGYGVQVIDDKNVAALDLTFLHKPYNITKLATTIRSLFDRKP
ncbi:MAG: response regulator [Deltaproteobacteria bacterium]|nr:response regulator [Deltaproteobacteria bacterium]